MLLLRSFLFTALAVVGLTIGMLFLLADTADVAGVRLLDRDDGPVLFDSGSDVAGGEVAE